MISAREVGTVGVNWKSVKAEHVKLACESLLGPGESALKKPRGLVVRFDNRELPVKDVLRRAYRLANGPGSDIGLDFASGESSLKLLRGLGFDAVRLSTAAGTKG